MAIEEATTPGPPASNDGDLPIPRSEPIGVAEVKSPANRPTDVEYDVIADELNLGRYNPKTQQYE